MLALLLLFVMILAGYVFASFSGADAAGSTPTPTPPPKHTPTTIYTDGMPAIAPRANGAMLTTADVERYISTHPIIGGQTVSGQAPQIMQVLLTTSQKASQIMGGEYVSASANLPVYYVLLNGPFLMENIHLPPGEPVPTAHEYEEVFDAQTGNLLVWGIAS